ncbi:Chase sensor signal transduction histidine kinase [Novosphingobium resinovorum]|uniref:histidine kinase n=1 Tax=Novosphingobium resinovorum TaxID=158500 RepID=A0A031J6Y8_9SPHN|nr:CHASE2 domain-containing protein [Novosphingobium resinovorum]EZP69599.1 Chase sensor signal transduction histidine kinase [Novosphingobium resinovorum]
MRLRRHLKLRTQWWLIVIVTSLLVMLMTMDRTMERFDNGIYDHLLQLVPSPSSDAILLVEIDDDSVGRIGRWPWNRATHAALIDRLNAAGAKAIGYDVLFTEPTDAANDDALAGAMARAMAGGAPVFLPVLPGASSENDATTILPIESLRKAAAGIGAATIAPDADGVVRAAPRSDEGPDGARLLMRVMAQSLAGGGHVSSQAGLIPFGGGTGRWPEVSAAAVLAGEVPAELLKGKIVLVGVTASGLGSRYATPAGGVMSGLEIQAYLLQGLRGGTMMTQADLSACLIAGLLPLWMLMMGLGPFRRMPALTCLALCSALVLGLSLCALILLRIWLPPSAALAGLVLAYPVWGWRQLAATERFMRTQLERLQEQPMLVPQRNVVHTERGVAYTIALLNAAITRNREMRHFVADRLDQLPDATIVADLNGDILLANVAARKLFASPDGGLEEKTGAVSILSRCRLIGSGDPVRFPPSAEEPLACEVQLDQGRFFLLGMAGQTSAEGTRVGWVIRFVDISDAKTAQKQRDDVVQLLTHDMRSPQASILAVLETAPADRIAARESGVIRHYAERTLQLADGFVQLARAENLEYALEEVDLGDMLMDAIDDLWPQSKAKSIGIVTHADERLLVTVERSLLTRVLVNVIGNAIKYSAEGTTITCSLSCQPRGDGAYWAVCAIEDQGPGIEPGLRQAIFERFRRGPVGLGPRINGAGLGLSFAHTVMTRHHGLIECQSEPGRGTAFLLKLPLHRGNPASTDCTP